MICLLNSFNQSYNLIKGNFVLTFQNKTNCVLYLENHTILSFRTLVSWTDTPKKKVRLEIYGIFRVDANDS